MNNYEIIACTIDFIEAHLSDDNLNLELIAAYIGYSKYHLHRCLKQSLTLHRMNIFRNVV